MCKAIYFDMDDTIYSLSGVDNWLPRLRAEDTTPYSDGKPLYNMTQLNSLLKRFTKAGIKIGVISWCAMNGTKEYDNKVRKVKKAWLKKYFSIASEIHITKYGYPKHWAAKVKDAILIDDNQKNCDSWNLGATIDGKKDIVYELNKLALSMGV